MNDYNIELIKKLTQAQGISGQESRVREIMRQEMEPFVDEVHISPLGNIFGTRQGTEEDPVKLMVAAHMDEVGFMVEIIHANGTISVVPTGGWNTYAIPAQRFTLQTRKGDYPIISAAVAPHLLRGKNAQSLAASDIRFDAGFESKEEAEKYGVRPGDAIVPDVTTIETANGKGFFAKAWDNRYGTTVVLDALRQLDQKTHPSNLIMGASVQEEVGLRGIKSAVHTFQPDVFLAVDCSPAGDSESNQNVQGKLGDGFLLRVQDPGHITHRGIVEYLHDTAESHQIPYQYYFSKGGTDATAAHVMNQGIPSGVLGVPARYIHGHQSLFYISDYEAASEMLYQIVSTFDRSTYESIIQKI